MAWFVFGENFDRRIALGISFIVLGSMMLTLEQPLSSGLPWGSLAVVGACWALDNNLTRAIAARDATQIAAIKGLAAGTTNLGLACLLGESWPGNRAARRRRLDAAYPSPSSRRPPSA